MILQLNSILLHILSLTLEQRSILLLVSLSLGLILRGGVGALLVDLVLHLKETHPPLEILLLKHILAVFLVFVD